MKIPLIIASDMSGALVWVFVWGTYVGILPLSITALIMSLFKGRARAAKICATISFLFSVLYLLLFIFSQHDGPGGITYDLIYAWPLWIPLTLSLAALALGARRKLPNRQSQCR
jgi:hypothetical protein